MLLLHLDEALFGLEDFLLLDVLALLLCFCEDFILLARQEAIEKHVADAASCDQATQCSN